jgi:hypothetical protein
MNELGGVYIDDRCAYLSLSPDAREEIGVCRCAVCGEWIYDGTDCVDDYKGRPVCMDCIEDMPTRKKFERVGVEVYRARDWRCAV